MDSHAQTTALSRRTFLTTTSAALVGATLGGLASQSEAARMLFLDRIPTVSLT